MTLRPWGSHHIHWMHYKHCGIHYLRGSCWREWEGLARQHRGNPGQEGYETNLVQGEKRRKLGTHRRRAIAEEAEGETADEEAPASSSNVPPDTLTGGRNTRRDAIPMEEHLTEEDWAIMAAVERCPVWRSLKSLNLWQREKLLAAVCMVPQELPG